MIWIHTNKIVVQGPMVIGWSQLIPYEQNPCELRVRCMKRIRDFAGSDSAKWAATLATHSSSGLLSSLLFLKDPVAQQGEAVLGANLLKASHSIALRMYYRPSSTTAINDPFESIKCPWLQRYPSIPRYLTYLYGNIFNRWLLTPS